MSDGNNEKARKYFERILEIDEEDTYSRFELAKIAIKEHNLPLARKIFKENK